MSLHTHDLAVGHLGRMVLSGLNLNLEAGQFLAILGPNGCGKSTLINTLSGAHPPLAGRITLDQLDLGDWHPRELACRRALLAQHTALDFNFTVFEVVLLGRAPHMSRGETPDDHAIVQRTLRIMDLDGLAERRYLSLSGGERQRVQCARVLAQIEGYHERYLFLDEPTNNLDPAHRFSLLEHIRGCCAKGMAAAIILHDLNLAMAYSTHSLLLKNGGALACGKTGDVLTEPHVSTLYDTVARKVRTGEDEWLFHLKPSQLEQGPSGARRHI